MPDPIIAEPPVVPGPEGKPEHERKAKPGDWVVVEHVGGDGAMSRLEAQRRKLEHAGITCRIEHDHAGRPALEVHRDDEREALKVLDRKHGDGAAGETDEARIEAEEKSALKGPFRAATVGWFVLAIAVIFALWYLAAFAFGFFH